MLVPSLSSRANIDIKKTLEVISEVVNGPLLISAYDFKYTKQFPGITFPDLIFFDSGGYEFVKDKDVSDIGLYKPDPHSWTRELHIKCVKKWSSNIPTVVISYDHPKERISMEQQISKANELFQMKEDVMKEILIKPETQNSRKVDISHLMEISHKLSDFDIIGFTEKELGSSILDRMVNISKIRLNFESKGIDKPIHIFGSLDTVTTPLYYISGADIFDGLSWLRFVFHNGDTLYIDSHGPRKEGIHETMNKIWITSIYNNYTYLTRMKLNLGRFQSSNDFTVFGENAEFFRAATDDLNEKLGGIL